MKLEIDELPANLKTLGTRAFYRAGEGIKFSFIPKDLKIISDYSLSGCPNITINYFGGEDSKLEKIGSNAFRNSGSSTVTTLTFKYPVMITDSQSLFHNGSGYADSITTIETHSLFEYDNEEEWENALFNWTSETSRSNEITTILTT